MSSKTLFDNAILIFTDMVVRGLHQLKTMKEVMD